MSTNKFENDFSENLKNILKSHDINALCELILERNNDYWQQNCWSHTHLLYEQITYDNFKLIPEWVNVCEQILFKVIDYGSIEEALLEFIEAIELCSDDKLFQTLLKLLENALGKCITREHSLEWSFTAIKRYISKIDCPENHQLEGDEQLLLDSDSNVQRINTIFDCVIQFVDAIADDSIHQLCACFLLQLLNKPFAALNLEHKFVAKSKSRLLAEQIVKLLNKFIPDLLFLISTIDNRTQCQDELSDTLEEQFVTVLDTIPLECLALLYYLIFVEGIELDSIPYVYNPVYLLQNCLICAELLLHEPHEHIIHKGLLLADSLLTKLPDNVASIVLDAEIHSKFWQQLINQLIYNPFQSDRQLAKQIFDKYFNKFSIEAQYLLIFNIFDISKHSGLRSLLITKYKQICVTNLDNCYTTGSYLRKFLLKFGSLPNKVETDVLEYFDQITAVLNLLIYLLVRDRVANTSGIWNCTDVLQTILLGPLKLALELSRAHYEARKKTLNDNSGKGDDVNNKFTVSVGNDQLSNLSTGEQLKAIDLAFNGFDLICSLLVRVNEIIESKN